MTRLTQAPPRPACKRRKRRGARAPMFRIPRALCARTLLHRSDDLRWFSDGRLVPIVDDTVNVPRGTDSQDQRVCKYLIGLESFVVASIMTSPSMRHDAVQTYWIMPGSLF
ncbi:hypothetical protein CONPUDRAFT_159434 [Coniophora puteana RWD-64-598 SS2]|uniref:Uncharacterized protein n=1 Tax=Coniophora puteana (strain RWD-64-598) TaxID=741705 RepID=A0A5M3M811_CONPW|nr:uncharacterized protein CONPUDRAFT_159434 [Coniophora puteana RWD-64-598 SS2]EIW75309.1 hypothetical protein CONPUDRAFT_159434 [Coniophora puteana RWD-64-598 SS2]